MRPALLALAALLLLCPPPAVQAEGQAAIPVVASEAPAVATPPAPGKTAAEIEACVQANFPSTTAVQRMEFHSQDRAGGGRTIESEVHWRRFEDGFSKVRVVVGDPADLRGSGVLLFEKKERADMFVYMPDLQRVKRVTTRMLSGSLFGSDFTYEDFSQLQGMAVEGTSERLPDADVGGTPVYVVAHYPAADSGSSYERVVSFVDTDTCLALKTEMYEPGERLRKVMTADSDTVFARDGVRLPQKILMQDLRDESQTELLVSEIEVGVKISRKIFDTGSLARARTR